MKRTITFLALLAVVAFTNQGIAGDKATQMENAKQAYITVLQNGNEQSVESTILQVMILNHVYPNMDYSDVYDELLSLSTQGKTPAIRIKAYIAVNYFNDNRSCSWISSNDYEKQYIHFSELSDNLLTQLEQSNQKLVADN